MRSRAAGAALAVPAWAWLLLLFIAYGVVRNSVLSRREAQVDAPKG